MIFGFIFIILCE